MLDIDKISKDIKYIFDRYSYNNDMNLLKLNYLDKVIINYIRKTHEEIKDLNFTERCIDMNKIFKIINDLKHQNFGK
jgi:hypothetical protein